MTLFQSRGARHSLGGALRSDITRDAQFAEAFLGGRNRLFDFETT
jgi:hypothetical protein